MFRPRIVRFLPTVFALVTAAAVAQTADTTWTFAVSGDSRNCGDFVMPAIAAAAKAENDAFYWHLGDFRWMSKRDQDLVAMLPPGKKLSIDEYHQIAWDDFLAHQIPPFGTMPVFLGRGNHETVPPMTRDGYVAKFATFLDRPEIAEQRKADGAGAGPVGPWYHWTHEGVDFITLDNASKDEFSDEQLKWLRGVLDRDLAPGSGIRAIVAGMHEALPHSRGSEHAMDDWDLGERSGDLVYVWFYGAQAAGITFILCQSFALLLSKYLRHTLLEAVLKSGCAGNHHRIGGSATVFAPKTAEKTAKSHIYGYIQGQVHADGQIDFKLHELSEDDLVKNRWPNAPAGCHPRLLRKQRGIAFV